MRLRARPALPDGTIEPHIFVAVAAGRPGAKPPSAIRFARDVFATVPNIKGVRITTSEPLRMGGQQGHQIFASAKDARAPARR